MSRTTFLENTLSGICTTISYPMWLVKWHTRGPRQPKLFWHLLLFWLKHLLFYALTMCTRRRCMDFGGWRASGVHGRVVINLQLSPKVSTQAKTQGGVTLYSTKLLGWSADAFTQYENFYRSFAVARDTRREEPSSLSFYSRNRHACQRRSCRREQVSNSHIGWRICCSGWITNTTLCAVRMVPYDLSLALNGGNGINNSNNKHNTKGVRYSVQNCKVDARIPLTTWINLICNCVWRQREQTIRKRGQWGR